VCFVRRVEGRESGSRCGPSAFVIQGRIRAGGDTGEGGLGVGQARDTGVDGYNGDVSV
jgi:hypothetical protein